MAAHSFLPFLAVSFSPVLPFTHSLWHCLSTRAGNRFFLLYALFSVSVPAAAATAFFISLRTPFFCLGLEPAAWLPVHLYATSVPHFLSQSPSLSRSPSPLRLHLIVDFQVHFALDSAQLSSRLGSPRLASTQASTA